MRTFPQKTLFNVGSVGNPLDGSLAAWTELEGNLDGVDPAPWNVRIVRVPYDIDRAIADARGANHPEAEE